MKKIGIALFVLVLLGAAAWFILPGEDTMGSEMEKDYAFAVENTGEIGRIFIANRKGQTTQLERRADHWVYNGKYRARQNAIDNLLDAIKRMELKNRPPNAMDSFIMRQMIKRGVKVEIYDRDGDLMKSYYVGGTNFKGEGVHMMMEGSDHFYNIELPGSNTLFDVRFRLTGDEWRDRSIFRLNVDEIDSLSVVYPGQASESFRIFREGRNALSIEPYDASMPESIYPFKEGSIEAYLREYKRVPAEAFRNDLPFLDSLIRETPFCAVRVVQGDEEERALFYPTEYPEVKGPDSEGFDKAYIFRYFVVKPGEDVFLAQHRLVERIFWGYSYFFEETKQLPG